ncbi:MAG: Nramp family divalent metal transporter [Acidobacteriota bacterium]|nr:Nramp family divalent metal transporter [Acidobacteriota bacterium]
MTSRPPGRVLSAVAPGLLIAATGVGAGDLLTAGLAGSVVGLSILWAAWVGALLKGFLNEGVARWQLATGTTLLEGWVRHLGRPVEWAFLVYFVAWSFFTGGALVNACGVAGTALLPLGDDLRGSKILWGAAHSLAGVVLVRLGGYRLFEKLMAGFIGLMFVSVLATAVLSRPNWAAVFRGLVTPQISSGQIAWMLGVLGGVGGTVTLLSYGYWIREEGREGGTGLRACRVDLSLGYVMTALFGVSMVVIGSGVSLERGPLMALDLASQLEEVIGPAGRWVFLVGFWGAVFSSLLGVWQSVPYLFADFLSIDRSSGRARPRAQDLASTRPYRAYLLALGVVPLPLLWMTVKQAQLAYAVLGAFFMPFLALTLLIMNNRSGWIGREWKSGWLANAVLAVTLLVFAWIGVRQVLATLTNIL